MARVVVSWFGGMSKWGDLKWKAFEGEDCRKFLWVLSFGKIMQCRYPSSFCRLISFSFKTHLGIFAYTNAFIVCVYMCVCVNITI